MEALEQLAIRASNLNYNEIMENLFSSVDFRKQAENLQKEQLYVGGVDSEGKSLGQYAESTKKKKRKKGLPVDHVTLYDTGDFYSTIETVVEGGEMQIKADPIKEGYNILQRYGNDVLGITDENISEIAKEAENKLPNLLLIKLCL